MEETKEEEYKRLSLPAKAAEVLIALKGERSWDEFIATIEERLEKSGRGQLAIYFERNLKAMGLRIDQVCQICKRRTTQPQVLEETNYLKLTLDFAKQENINISEQELQVRFSIAGITPQAKGCPHCLAYEGYLTFESLLDSVLPEYSAAILKDIYQSMKCNTKA